MKNNIALLRYIASSAYRISMICSLALCVILVSATAVNAQIPSSYGKSQIINGHLKFTSMSSSSYRSTQSLGSTTRIISIEPLGDRLAKLDYITKYPDISLAMRVNGYNYALCLIRTNAKDNSSKSNPTIRISGALKVSSTTPVPVKTVAEESKKEEEKKDEQNKEEAKKAEQIFPIIVLLQDKSGIVQLLVQTDESTLLEYKVRNFWELFIIIPENCKKDLFELMKYFNPAIFTSEQNTVFRVYNAISKSVPINPDIQNEYKQLIDDLSSDVYMKRVAAMDRIQNEGLNFHAFVQNLNLSQLEPEAQVRLVRFLEQESYVAETDSVDDMSILFANSLYAYIPLLESDNLPFYAIAQERLKAKLGDSFKFDKSAPDDVRAAQIQELKNALGFPKSRTIQMDKQTQEQFKDLTDAIFDPSLSVFKF